MPTMKIEMTIPELQSFIATNRVNIECREISISHTKFVLKMHYEELNDWIKNNPSSTEYPEGVEECFQYIKEDKRDIKQRRRDLAHYVKLQIAAKKALRKAYEDQREAVMIDLVNEALRLNRERAEHQNEFVANIIVC